MGVKLLKESSLRREIKQLLLPDVPALVANTEKTNKLDNKVRKGVLWELGMLELAKSSGVEIVKGGGGCR